MAAHCTKVKERHRLLLLLLAGLGIGTKTFNIDTGFLPISSVTLTGWHTSNSLYEDWVDFPKMPVKKTLLHQCKKTGIWNSDLFETASTFQNRWGTNDPMSTPSPDLAVTNLYTAAREQADSAEPPEARYNDWLLCWITHIPSKAGRLLLTSRRGRCWDRDRNRPAVCLSKRGSL